MRLSYRYLILFITLVLIDGASKRLALRWLADAPMKLFPGCRLVLERNYGISWSLLQANTTLSWLALCTMIGLLLGLFLSYTQTLYLRNQPVLGEILVLAGGLSNLRDRLKYGYVIDFIDLYVGDWSWPTFNGADMCIVIGVGIMVYQMIRSKT